MVKGGGVGGSALCIVGLKPLPPSVIIIPSRSSLVEVLSVLEARVCVIFFTADKSYVVAS